MAESKSLKDRIAAEFAEFQRGVENFQASTQAEFEAREKRFRDLFQPAVERIVALVKPKLQMLVEQFKDRVNVQPTVSEHLREVVLKFDTPVARTNLTFGLSHDTAVQNLVLDRSLEILPILMKFEPHARLTTPLDKLDEAQIGTWFDDQIVSFVQTYAAMHQNQYYLKDHLVTDPIAGVQMPKFAAKAQLESGGKTYYFISEETKSAFETKSKAK